MHRIGAFPRQTIAERLSAHSYPVPDGCVLWTGWRTVDGYGIMSVKGRLRRVHRLAWEQAHGPIPDGMTIEHMCSRKACINAEEHMALLTPWQNVAMYWAHKRADAS